MQLVYTHQAKNDLSDAYDWYKTISAELAEAFLSEVELAIHHILLTPLGYQKVHAEYRRYVVRKFPFSIFYTIMNHQVIIHAVFDNRQSPNRQPQ